MSALRASVGEVQFWPGRLKQAGKECRHHPAAGAEEQGQTRHPERDAETIRHFIGDGSRAGRNATEKGHRGAKRAPQLRLEALGRRDLSGLSVTPLR